MDKVTMKKMDLEDKIRMIYSSISGNPAREQELAQSMGRNINPADLGDYKAATVNPLPGYRTFWEEAGNIGGKPFSAGELEYLSRHPMEVANFMGKFASPAIAGAQELNNFYD